MVLKPAEQTPLSALAVAVLAEEAGLPAGVLSVVTGDAEDAPVIGGEMTSSPLVRKLGFTGSTEVGKLLMAQCAPGLKKISLELGGNAPFIVFDDADLDEAVAGDAAEQVPQRRPDLHLARTGSSSRTAPRRVPSSGSSPASPGWRSAPARAGREGRAADRPGGAREGRAARRRRARRAAPSSHLGGSRHELGQTFFEPTVLTGVTAGDGDELRGDVRPGRRDRALRDRGGGGRGSPTTRRTGSPPTSTAATSAASGASRRGSTTGSSGSTPASSPPRSPRSAG